MKLPLHPHPDVVFCRVSDDEAICLQMATMTYFGLNRSAIVLWDALASLAAAEEVASCLVARFSDLPQDALATSLAFLRSLWEARLVHYDADASQPSQRASTLPQVPYSAPQLKRYDVLQQAQVYMGGSSVVPGGGATGGTVPVSGL